MLLVIYRITHPTLDLKLFQKKILTDIFRIPKEHPVVGLRKHYAFPLPLQVVSLILRLHFCFQCPQGPQPSWQNVRGRTWQQQGGVEKDQGCEKHQGWEQHVAQTKLIKYINKMFDCTLLSSQGPFPTHSQILQCLFVSLTANGTSCHVPPGRMTLSRMTRDYQCDGISLSLSLSI